ncbi:MAG: M20 family metallopeptidase, partial [Clostridia bacterium]
MDTQTDIVRQKAQAMSQYLSSIRRQIHMHPELGEQEFETQRTIIGQLDELGIEHIQYPNYTAVVGIIRGGLPGETVGLRADIDALPLTEVSGREYGSKIPGKMHACGHDAHTTILLGAARILHEMRAQLKGNVKLFFQPAEETCGGAEKMIKLGCMENPHVTYMLGLHLMPRLAVGHAETRFGALNGSSDDINICIHGQKSHGASPQDGVDAIAVAANVVCALQQLVSRRTSPLDSVVVSIGQISGGTAANIICDEVHMCGTLRTLSPAIRARMKSEIARVVENTCAAMGARGQCVMHSSYCALINDDEAVKRTLSVLKLALGEQNVHMKELPSLGVEDFSYFLEVAPGAFYHIGAAPNPTLAENWPPLHSSEFDIDERVLSLGAELQAKLVIDYLSRV